MKVVYFSCFTTSCETDLRKIGGLGTVCALGLTAFIYLNNTNLLAPSLTGEAKLIAHRGFAQRFETLGLTNETCTATRMLPPTHNYLENTISSMKASFDAGADVVEFDVHPTTDGQFAVFHDWTLECRTNGQGVTREKSMAYLKTLDIGYGYTADDGRTYPFRGKAIGLMPSLSEVLDTFPDKYFLVNIKSNDENEGDLFSNFILKVPPGQRSRLMIYGGDKPISVISSRVSGVKTISRGALKSCLLRYAAVGWTGAVPEACQSRIIFVPINIAPWIWGWPNRFMHRMNDAGSLVVVIGPYEGGDFSAGLDNPQDIAKLPPIYNGAILTNETKAIVSLLRSKQAASGK